MNLPLTLAQINPVVGDIAGNAAALLSCWRNAKAGMVITPELSLTGYPCDDLILKPAFIEAAKAAFEALLREGATFPSALAVGLPWSENGQIYNALFVIKGGEILHRQFKVHLPNYGVFEEKRVFSPGALPSPFEYSGVKIGFLICEDAWHADIALHLRSCGVEIIISSNASPFGLKNIRDRREIAAARVRETGLPLVYVNQTGGQDDLVFDGESFVLNADGKEILRLPAFEEAVRVYSHDANSPAPLLSGMPDTEEELVYKALTLGIKDYVAKNKCLNVILGLSGGIDSALVAALAVDALGADKVRGVMLPSAFTSSESVEDAAACAALLGCAYDVLPIGDAVSSLERSLNISSGTAHENLQSRVRGVILMALSNSTGALLLSTGNKSEMAVGYATLYGDMNGAYNPLKDVYKTKVYALARWRNARGRVIPERVLTKAPTAELRPGQTDQDSLPPYPVLDAILECLIEGDMGVRETAALGFDVETVIRVERLLTRAEFKRRQSCPGPRITSRAFGRERRYPITSGFTDHIENPPKKG